MNNAISESFIIHFYFNLFSSDVNSNAESFIIPSISYI